MTRPLIPTRIMETVWRFYNADGLAIDAISRRLRISETVVREYVTMMKARADQQAREEPKPTAPKTALTDRRLIRHHAERDAAIIKLIRQGFTSTAAAARLGLSRGVVAGVMSRQARETHRKPERL